MPGMGQVSHHNTLSKIILQGTVESKLCKARQKKSQADNVKDWTIHSVCALIYTAENRQLWEISDCLSIHHSTPTTVGPGKGEVVVAEKVYVSFIHKKIQN